MGHLWQHLHEYNRDFCHPGATMVLSPDLIRLSYVDQYSQENQQGDL